MSSVLNEQEAFNFDFFSGAKEAGTGTLTEKAGHDDQPDDYPVLSGESVDTAPVDTSPTVIQLDCTEEEEKGRSKFSPKVIFHESGTKTMESPSTTNVIIDMLKQVEEEKQKLQKRVVTLEEQLETARKRDGNLEENDKLMARLDTEKKARFKEETKVKSYVKILGELQEELRVEKEKVRMAESAVSSMETETTRLKGEMAANELIIKESFQRQRETYLNEYADLDSKYQKLLHTTGEAGIRTTGADEFDRKVKAFEHDKRNFDIYKRKRMKEFDNERKSIQLSRQKMEEAMAQKRFASNKPRGFQPMGYNPSRMASEEYDQPYEAEPFTFNQNHDEFMRAYKRHKSMGPHNVQKSSITDSTEALDSRK